MHKLKIRFMIIVIDLLYIILHIVSNADIPRNPTVNALVEDLKLEYTEE